MMDKVQRFKMLVNESIPRRSTKMTQLIEFKDEIRSARLNGFSHSQIADFLNQ